MQIDPAAFNDVTREILGAAIEVHRTLGPGLFETTYVPCFKFELTARNLKYVAHRGVPIIYKGVTLDTYYVVDLIVEDLVVIELKSVATLAPVFEAQLLTYLRLTGCPVGLLINFNVPRLMDGVKRLINPRAAVAEKKGGTNAKETEITETTVKLRETE